LSYLVANGVIPPEWSEAVEDVEATDTEVARMNLLRERLLDTKPQVHRAIAQYPAQPIVRYQWPSGRELVLWEQGSQAIKRSHLITKKRAVLYRNDDAGVTITDEDVDTAVSAPVTAVWGRSSPSCWKRPSWMPNRIEWMQRSPLPLRS
jgi:hypothetical protein